MGSLVKVFYSPKEVFQRVDDSPHWGAPFVTVVLISLIVTAVLLPTVIQPSALERFDAGIEGTEEQMAHARRFVSGPVFYVMSIGTVLVVAPAKLLAQAGIFALFLLFLRGEVNFKKILGVASYCGLISVLGNVVKGLIMLARRSTEVYTNLNLFLPFLARDIFLFRLFSHVDFFTIWSLLLLGLGLSTVAKIETKRSYTLVFSLWIVGIVLVSFAGGLGARFGGVR